MNSAAQLSNPWSISSPKGPLELVRLACFPSIPSKVWAKKWLAAQANHTHDGTGGLGLVSLDAEKSLSYIVSKIPFATVNKNPVKVKTFGANHFGTIYKTLTDNR